MGICWSGDVHFVRCTFWGLRRDVSSSMHQMVDDETCDALLGEMLVPASSGGEML